ncbi:hypothetical protein N7537_011460 [Penicillium hordei]|uniref:Uncharacterized protein n=1 Tax=Penicillium hordei TaxID=40994 RepID=A0AAD6GTM2_9EURO|nr:uncharacterized protein N7537_011460 [Penicillium hordei]KAJ5588782.1 hypothetical protein N7537_011460 [Penicillium hordei]
MQYGRTRLLTCTSAANAPKVNGCIDIAAFKAAAEQLNQASTAFAGSKDTKLFFIAKQDLEECIRIGKLPKSWNIEWEVFLDFHRERVGRSNADGSQHKSISIAQRDIFEEEEEGYNDEDVEVEYHEYSGVDYEEEEEEAAVQNGYYEDENDYRDEYDDDDNRVEEYGGHTDEENEDGYDEYSGDDSEDDDKDEDSHEDETDQENPGHDSIGEGPKFAYHTERELECVDISLIRRRAQNHYGLLLTSGSILGWRKTKSEGLLAVMGYECRGNRTSRVKQHKDTNGAQESVMKDRSLSILGVGLIAWEVDAMSVFEPIKSLYPTPNGTYPATFIAVRWEGDVWTWESREDFHYLMGDLSQFEVDILLYFMAISQEGDYLKSMTGKRPKFPGIAST